MNFCELCLSLLLRSGVFIIMNNAYYGKVISIFVFSIFWMNKEKKTQIVYSSHKLKAHDIIKEHLAIIKLNIYTHLKPHRRQQIQVQLYSFMYHVFERFIRMIHLNNS